MRGLKARTNFHYPTPPASTAPPPPPPQFPSPDFPWRHVSVSTPPPPPPHASLLFRNLITPSSPFPSSSFNPSPSSLFQEHHYNTTETLSLVTSDNAPAMFCDDCSDFFSPEPPGSGLLQEVIHGFYPKRESTVEVVDVEAMKETEPMSLDEMPGQDGICFGYGFGENFPTVSEGLLEDIIQYPEFFEMLPSKLHSGISHTAT